MLANIKKELLSKANARKAETQRGFFKHCKDDTFLGIPSAEIKALSKAYQELPLPAILKLAESDVHEERSLAHAILRLQFDKADEKQQEVIYKFYLKSRRHIRDWDGVDDSAPYIVGKHLLNRDKKILYALAVSKHLWSRRIAIVSTWWFIRNQKFEDALKIAKILLNDKEDLIHKAVGWMLREIGKRDLATLKTFLNIHYAKMPRTSLRYAIERFEEKERKAYLNRA